MKTRAAVQDDPTTCVYEVDAEFRILRVDFGWSTFAASNRAPELASPDGVIGRSVLAFVADGTTAMLYERLFRHVLARQTPVAFPIRCDAPARRRFLRLEIAPGDGGGLRIETTLVRSEDRPAVALLDPDAPRAGAALRMCGWCKAVDVSGRWCEVEEAVAVLRLFERESLPPTTHGMCPACYEQVCDEMADEQDAA